MYLLINRFRIEIQHTPIKCHKIEGMLVKTKILNNFEGHVSRDSTNAQNHKIFKLFHVQNALA